MGQISRNMSELPRTSLFLLLEFSIPSTTEMRTGASPSDQDSGRSSELVVCFNYFCCCDKMAVIKET